MVESRDTVRAHVHAYAEHTVGRYRATRNRRFSPYSINYCDFFRVTLVYRDASADRPIDMPQHQRLARFSGRFFQPDLQTSDEDLLLGFDLELVDLCTWHFIYIIRTLHFTGKRRAQFRFRHCDAIRRA